MLAFVRIQDLAGVFITHHFLEIAANKAGKGWADDDWPKPLNALVVQLKPAMSNGAASWSSAAAFPRLGQGGDAQPGAARSAPSPARLARGWRDQVSGGGAGPA